MNRSEKEQYVIQLYKENKTTREIAKLTHMSFRDIGIIKKKVELEAHGETGPSEEDDDIKSKSETTQAIKLFSEFKSPVDVIIALDLPANQVLEVTNKRKIYEGFLTMDSFNNEKPGGTGENS
jgi:hypothetical protein